MAKQELTFHDKVIEIQSELKAPKGQYNKFGKYNYRNQEDILEAVKPLLAKHGLSLTITDEVKAVEVSMMKRSSRKESKIIYDESGKIVTEEENIEFIEQSFEVGMMPFIESRAILHSPDGNVEAKAQAGIDPNRKGMDIAQSFGSSSSYARKYALNGLFLIDDTKDPDATNTHDKPTTSNPKKAWLNEGTAEYSKAVAFLEKGGNIEKIKENFNISKAVLAKLTNNN